MLEREGNEGMSSWVSTRVAKFLEQNRVGELSTREFLGRQFDEGLAWVHFDEGVGGLGADFEAHRLVMSAMTAAGAPDPRDLNPLGWGVIAPAIHEHGDRALKERLLRPLFVGDDRYCQLFSEPGAGSDLAGLATRAHREDGGWRIVGQKVWTSLAQTSSKAALLARTDPNVPKHQGITFFVIDMHQPGVEVRPLRQITGESHFNEVFLNDAFVADEDRVGDVGDGWRVATTALVSERLYNSERSSRRNNVNGLEELSRALDAAIPDGSVSTTELVRAAGCWVELEALRLWQQRARSGGGGNRSRGAAGKVLWAEVNQRAFAVALDIIGSGGLLNNERAGEDIDRDGFESVVGGYLRSRAFSIEGGTSEMQRNVIGERLLGLPSEPRLDRGPWSEVPR